MSGLSVSDVVNVQVLLSPTAAAERNFGSLMILGDSSVIDTFQRFRQYSSLAGVGSDFGTNAPEYQAAINFFSASPTPANVYIGRWASSASHGSLRGVALTSSQQAIGNFTGVLNGGVNFTIDGVAKNLTGLNFSGQTNLNGVAAVVQAAFAGAATCVWDSNNNQFVVTSASTGTGSTVSFGSVGSGVDVSALLGLQSTQGGYIVSGIAAESLASCVNTFLSLTNVWYGLQVAATNVPQTSDYLAVAAIIEAASPSHIFGVTSQDTNCYSSVSTTDVAAQLQAGNFKRTFCQFSSTDAYASAGIFGRAFTVDFTGSNTVITIKFKQEPGVVAETLTETQAAVLNSKNCNVFVNYNNNTAILQQGTMANGYFFDEVHGTDWLQSEIQTDVYNALYTSPTKIPQTDAGVSVLANVVANACEMAVNNGFVAPGVWTGPDVGVLSSGQMLTTGYYVFQPPIATQSAADRQARIAPTIQAAIKLAGAVHFANIIVNVNR